MDRDRSTFFECDVASALETAGMRCTVRGEALIELNEPVVLANLPARSGESAASGRFRYRIERVSPSAQGQVKVEVTATGINLTSRDGWRKWGDDIEVFLVNPRSGKHTRIGYSNGTCFGGPGWVSLKQEYSIEARTADEQVDPTDFLKDARLYLIGQRYRGTVRVPFEIADVELVSGR